jgi:hypothetical protein
MRRGRRLARAAVLAVACAGLFALAFGQSLAGPFNSDGAANVLQAQAMLGGNVLLRGWWTSDVSFYLTELPEYALGTAVRGVTPAVVHLCGALTYTLAVLLAALLARGRAAGGPGLFRTGLAVAIMLAPGLIGGTEVFLENPDHAGTAVPVLLLLVFLDRADGCGRPGGRRWLVPIVTCALLAVSQLSDALTLAVATVPLAAVCAARLLVIRGGPAEGGLAEGELAEGGRRRDGLLLAAAVASVPVANLGGLVIRSVGGFDVRPMPYGVFAPLSWVPANARVLGESLLQIYGASTSGAPSAQRELAESAHAPLEVMACLHILGMVLAACGLVVGMAGLFSRPAFRDPQPRSRVNQVLVAAIVVTLAAGLFCTVLRSLSNAHEIAILVPLSAALAGRVLPERLTKFPGRLAALALGAWLAVGLAEFCYAATRPPLATTGQAVAAWLVGHHERDGLAGYWQAASTTVASGGRVLVAPVTARAGAPDRTAPDRWESSAAWYRPAIDRATFVIAVADPAATGGALTAAEVLARFGPPAGRYLVGADIIMTYRYNLLTRVPPAGFPG